MAFALSAAFPLGWADVKFTPRFHEGRLRPFPAKVLRGVGIERVAALAVAISPPSQPSPLMGARDACLSLALPAWGRGLGRWQFQAYLTEGAQGRLINNPIRKVNLGMETCIAKV